MGINNKEYSINGGSIFVVQITNAKVVSFTDSIESKVEGVKEKSIEISPTNIKIGDSLSDVKSKPIWHSKFFLQIPGHNEIVIRIEDFEALDLRAGHTVDVIGISKKRNNIEIPIEIKIIELNRYYYTSSIKEKIQEIIDTEFKFVFKLPDDMEDPSFLTGCSYHVLPVLLGIITGIIASINFFHGWWTILIFFIIAISSSLFSRFIITKLFMLISPTKLKAYQDFDKYRDIAESEFNSSKNEFHNEFSAVYENRYKQIISDFPEKVIIALDKGDTEPALKGLRRIRSYDRLDINEQKEIFHRIFKKKKD